jgi:hypothetical protein
MQNQYPNWQPQPWPPQPWPVKKKSNLWLILGLCIGIPVLVLALLVAAALVFTATAETTPASPADRRLALTVDDIAPFIEDFEADTSRETANRVGYFDGSYEIEYIYDADDLYIESYVSIEPSASDAKYSYSGYQAGTSIGFSLAEEDVTEVAMNHLFEWGDESRFYLLSLDGQPIGNRLIARKGRKVVYVIWSGVYFNDPESTRELLEPVMARIDTAVK